MNPTTIDWDWNQYFTPDGREYFFNSRTNESVWERPSNYKPPPPRKKEFAVSRKIINDNYWIVLTNLNHELFYNVNDKTSSWDIPEDLVDEVQRMLMEAEGIEEDEEDEEEDSVDSMIENEQDVGMQQESTRHELQVEPVQTTEPSAAPPSPKKAPESDKKKLEADYKQLLIESANVLSTWAIEKPKLMNDPRFLSNPKRAKILFEEYCAIQARQVLNNKKQDDQHQFIQLLNDNVHSPQKFEEFHRNCKNDIRFSSVPSQERVKLFNDHLKSLAQLQSRQKKLDFISMLKEYNIGKDYTWLKTRLLIEKDSRYHAIPTILERENIFRQYLQKL
jgi:transcription elongation regulator 1